MKKNHSQEEYLKILNGIKLKKLGFFEIQSKFYYENYKDGDVNTEIKNESKYQESSIPNSYSGLDIYEIVGSIDEKPLFKVNLTIVLALESEQIIDLKFWKGFEQNTLRLMTYPYVREIVQELTSKMGLQPCILPLWRKVMPLEETIVEETAQ